MLGDPYALLLVRDTPDLLALEPHGQAVAVQVGVVKLVGQAEGHIGRQQPVPFGSGFTGGLRVETGVRAGGGVHELVGVQREACQSDFQRRIGRCYGLSK